MLHSMARCVLPGCVGGGLVQHVLHGRGAMSYHDRRIVALFKLSFDGECTAYDMRLLRKMRGAAVQYILSRLVKHGSVWQDPAYL